MKSRWIAALALLVALPIIAWGFWSLRQDDTTPAIEDYGQLPAFHLVAQTGRPFGLDQLKGHVWIAGFFFTHCPGQCPLVTAKLRRLQNLMADVRSLRIVSFTVDPERDTPAVLSDYAAKSGADPRRWIFLTGPRRNLDALSSNGFRLGSGGVPTAHSFKLVLLDSHAHIRGYYDGLDDQKVQALERDARALVKSLAR